MVNRTRPIVIGVRVTEAGKAMLAAMGMAESLRPPTVLYRLAQAELTRRRRTCRHPATVDGYCTHCGADA